MIVCILCQLDYKAKPNNFINSQMQTVGAGTRRKSYAYVEPSLPRQSYTRDSGTRTVYKELPDVKDQLKSYRRKLVFDNLESMASRETGKEKYDLPQLTNYHSENLRKNNQTLMTMGSETEAKLATSRTQLSEKPQPPPTDPQPQDQQIRLNIDQDNNPQQPDNQDEQIQGYTMGQQVQPEQQEEEDKEKMVPKLKSYATSQLHFRAGKLVNRYEPVSEAQARMELKYLEGKYENLRARREDNEILGMVNQYKVNKRLILKQSDRKMETMKALATIRRASSLPKLNRPEYSEKVQQIIVPSYEELINPDGNPEEYRRKLLAKRLENSMSFGRLQIGSSKQGKDINYEAHLEEQLGYLVETQRILREKGVKISANTLKSSLLNLRDVSSLPQAEPQFPKPSLISNPFHPKQASKKKKR